MSQWYGASERRLTQRLNQVCRRLCGASTIGEWELALRDGVQLFAEAFMLLRIEADWVAEVEGAREHGDPELLPQRLADLPEVMDVMRSRNPVYVAAANSRLRTSQGFDATRQMLLVPVSQGADCRYVIVASDPAHGTDPDGLELVATLASLCLSSRSEWVEQEPQQQPPEELIDLQP